MPRICQNPKQTDPDKRTLLLAGNRKGNVIALKEPIPGERTWRTRYVNTFCPRGFSAIRTPDATLGSRTIVIPLIRTHDRSKANADPQDYRLCPHDRSALVDDLWAVGLAHLAALTDYETKVNERATLTGRNLEPWRAVLAVALWLEDHGATGLWERIENLSVAYQGERAEIESGDMTALVIRSLCRCIGADVSDVSDIADVRNKGLDWTFTTKFITETAKTIAEELELDINPEHITSRRLGKTLRKLRFRTAKKGRTSERAWRVTASEIERWLLSLGLISEKSYTQKQTSVTSDMSATSASDADESGTTDEDLAEVADFFESAAKESSAPGYEPVRDEEGREYSF